MTPRLCIANCGVYYELKLQNCKLHAGDKSLDNKRTVRRKIQEKVEWIFEQYNDHTSSVFCQMATITTLHSLYIHSICLTIL